MKAIEFGEITQKSGHYAVQGYRLYVKFSLATGGRFTLVPSLGWYTANIAISDIPLKTRFFRQHFTPRMFRCIFNHFYVIGPQSYGIRQNNSNYMAITPFRVIQGHRFWYYSKAICDFLLVINSNLPLILHRFQVMADYWSNFRYRHGSCVSEEPPWTVCDFDVFSYSDGRIWMKSKYFKSWLSVP